VANSRFRVALGARFSSIIRGSLCEAFLIAAAGAALGMLVASWSIGPLLSLVPETVGIPAISIDWRALVRAAAITTLVTILVAIVPATISFRTDPNEALREGGRANVSAMRGVRIRNALEVSEVALAAALAILAGLVIKSFNQLIKVDPGFDARRALTLTAEVGGPAYATDAQRTAFWRDVLDRASSQPSSQGWHGEFSPNVGQRHRKRLLGGGSDSLAIALERFYLQPHLLSHVPTEESSYAVRLPPGGGH